jgi:hypothetical protein
MTKAGAIAILSAIFLGLAGWAGNEIVSIKERTARVETIGDNIKESLEEIKQDVKENRKTTDAILLMVRRK